MVNDAPEKERKKAERVVERVLGEGDAKYHYLARQTIADRVLAATILPFIPRFVTPNQITVFRFVCIPFVLTALFLKLYPLATILFVIAAFSDAVDGAIARTRGQVTAWGIMFDPIADKLLVGLTALMLVSATLGLVLTAVILTLEVAIVSSVYFRYSGAAVPAKTVGKLKMVLQCFGLGFLLLYVNFGTPLLLTVAEYTLYGAIFFALLSLFVYRSI